MSGLRLPTVQRMDTTKENSMLHPPSVNRVGPTVDAFFDPAHPIDGGWGNPKPPISGIRGTLHPSFKGSEERRRLEDAKVLSVIYESKRSSPKLPGGGVSRLIRSIGESGPSHNIAGAGSLCSTPTSSSKERRSSCWDEYGGAAACQEQCTLSSGEGGYCKLGNTSTSQSVSYDDRNECKDH